MGSRVGVVLLAVAPAAVAAPAPDPTCDFPAQATVPAGATVCEHTTGAQGMEPMLAVNRRGTLFMGMATDKGLYEDPGEAHRDRPERPAAQPRRRPHLAAHPLPGGIDASEGFPYIDPVTDRLFVTSVSADATRCGQPVIHSDDEGATWTAAAARPGCSPATARGLAEDLQRPVQGQGAGPLPDRRLRLQLHPEHPRRRVDRLLALRRRRGPLRVHRIPADDQRPLQGRGRPGRHGGDDRPRQRAGARERRRRRPADRVRLPRGGAQQRRGEDVDGDRHRGTERRAGGHPRAGARDSCSAITDHVWSENLAIDDHDNLYFAYIRDGVHLMVSRDGGRSWRQLGIVTPPSIVHAIVVSVTARGSGEVALSYYATPDKGDAFGAQRHELARVDDLQPRRAGRQARVPQRADLAGVGADDGRGACTAAARPSRPSSSTRA